MGPVPVQKALEKTYPSGQDGEWAFVMQKVRHSPYGPWGLGYSFVMEN